MEYLIFHVGHIKHFETTSDVLIVSITTDKFVIKAQTDQLLMKTQDGSFSCSTSIDYVVVSNFQPTILQKIKPNIYCKGNEYKNFKNDTTGEIKNENKVLKNSVENFFYFRYNF